VTYGYHEHKGEVLKRLRRIEGQVRGLEKMVEEDRYCIDILTQISAANNALKKVAVALLDDHIAHCVVGADEETRRSSVSEATDAIDRLLRS
jgi:DNA-binding FrmR family transcriptional regulator